MPRCVLALLCSLSGCWLTPLREAPPPARTITLDENKPAPRFFAYSPATPSDSPQAILLGESEAGSIVHVFAGETCGDTSAVQALTGADGRFQVAIEVLTNSTLGFVAFAEFSDATTSACTGMGAYTHDDLPPALSAAIVSPGRSVTPAVVVTSEPLARVSLFAAPGCQGSAIATAVIAEAGTISLSGVARLEGTLVLSVRARDPAGNSACADVTYVHDGQPPQLSVTLPPGALAIALDVSDSGTGVRSADACVALDPSSCPAGFAPTHSLATAGGSVSIDVPGLVEDAHYFVRVRATDAAGNVAETELLGLRTAGDRAVRKVAVGAGFKCALLADGRVRCLGKNDAAQTSAPVSPEETAPVLVRLQDGTPLENVIDVAAGAQHACALTAALEPYCWGANVFGQLGGSYVVSTSVPHAFAGIAAGGSNPAVRAMALGEKTSCFLLVTGKVICVGDNEFGQIGQGGACDNTSSTPCVTPVLHTPSPWSEITRAVNTDLDGVVQIAGNAAHFCALRWNGEVWCWGRNDGGQLGIGDTLTRARANLIPGFGTAVAVTTTAANTCALAADGSVRCAGVNNGILGVSPGTLAQSSTPVVVPGITATEISGGAAFFCARDIDGAVSCRGDAPGMSALLPAGSLLCGGASCCTLAGGRSDCFGDGPAGLVAWGKAAAGVEKVAAGDAHTCALLTNGEIVCWGEDEVLPHALVSSRRYRDVAAGAAHTCALADDGMVDCFADGMAIEKARAIAAGGGHTCLLGAGGGVRCFGDNGAGQLGRGGAGTALGDMASATAVKALALGGDHSCLLLASGGVQCAGANASGQLGDNGGIGGQALVTALDDLSASALADTAELWVAGARSCARLTAGTLKCWGDNTGGGLGVNSGASAVVRARTVAGVTALTIGAASGTHTCAMPAGCFGSNASAAVSTFAEAVLGEPFGLFLPSTVAPRALALGRETTFLLDARGRLYARGRNDRAQLGLGFVTPAETTLKEVPHVP